MSAATVLEYKPLSSGAARGVISIVVPPGMMLHGCMVLETEGRRWVAPPSRVRVYGTEVQTGYDGRPIYDPIVTFADRAGADAFSTMALVALDEYLARGEQNV